MSGFGQIQGEERPISSSFTPVWSRIQEAARDAPEAIAVVSGDLSSAAAGATKQLTYGQLWSRSRDLALQLMERGIGSGDLVAVLCDRGPAFAVAALASWLAGSAYVPLDASLPPLRRAAVLRSCGAKAVLFTASHRAACREITGAAIEVGSDGCAAQRSGGEDTDQRDGGPPLTSGAADHLPPVVTALDPAYVVFTSGTTGTPKGVVVPHGALENLTRWATRYHGLTHHDRVLHTFGLGFDAAVVEIWPTLWAGATVVTCSESSRIVPEFLIEEAVAQRCTIVWATTAIVEHIVRQGLPLPGVRRLLTGGEALKVRPEGSATYAVVNHYGPTEATVITTSHVVEPGGVRDEPPPIGAPIEGVDVVLCRPDGQPVPEGAVGEVLIGGAGLALGYLGDQRETDAAFVLREGRRWYRSGDLAVRQGSVLHFRGRKDGKQLKLNGQRIEVDEIEAALLEVPHVVAACAVMTDVGLGALLVLPRPHSLDERDVRAHLRDSLPWAAHPRWVVCARALPLTVNGKVDRNTVNQLILTRRQAVLERKSDDQPLHQSIPDGHRLRNPR